MSPTSSTPPIHKDFIEKTVHKDVLPCKPALAGKECRNRKQWNKGVKEINFDGLVGPSHNYAGLSFGNVASTTHAGSTSHPRTAALQGVEKMRFMMQMGLRQGILLPHERPDTDFLRQCGFTGSPAEIHAKAWQENPALFRAAFSASSMWTANAGTVSPAPDTSDGRCHVSVANLSSNLHRSLEARQTSRQLRTLFAHPGHFKVHEALPGALKDEGAANFMRLCSHHAAPGLEILVHGAQGSGGFPARQSHAASEAIVRRHGLDPARTFLVQQSDVAIQAGAFHNDVVAVANETVLLTHELAFERPDTLYDFIHERLPEANIIIVPQSEVSLQDAIASYLFNAQLVTLPDGGMMLVVPAECRANKAVSTWLDRELAGNGPIRRIEVMDLRESMHNGGGPACLRLRVALSEAAEQALDPRFLPDEHGLDALARLITTWWPERIAPTDLGNPDLWKDCHAARLALLEHLDLKAALA